MLQLSGEEQFSQSTTEILSRLTDAAFLAECMPGLESISQLKPGLAMCRVRPGLSFARGTLKLTLEVLQQQPLESVQINVQCKGIGSSATVETVVQVSEVEAGTQLAWDAEVKELGGLLKPVSRTLIGAAARKLIADGWSGFRDRLPS